MIDMLNEETLKYINNREKLREYQAEAVYNALNIYSSEKHNRFAAVVMPTGSGKSFIAMSLMQMVNNPNFTAEIFDINKPINNSKMLYVAPYKDILLQIKIHIVKHIFIPNMNKQQNSIFKGMTKEEILNSPELIDKIVFTLFPNLKLKCYAGMEGKNGETIQPDDPDILTEKDVENMDFIITDEAHRVGAEDWSKKYGTIIKNNNAKIIAISATPERNDKEGKEMMAGIAKMLYKDEVVLPEEYMAQEIYVLDAMRDGLISVPKVVSSNFYLYYSTEYQDVLNRWRRTRKTKEKEELGNILDEMESLIGISSKEYPGRVIPEKILKQKRIEVTNSLIKEELNSNSKYGSMKANDKAIVFIPNREDRSQDLKEFYDKYIEEVREYYKGVIDPKTGQQIEFIPHILSSNLKDQENAKNLADFENASETLSGIHILVVQDKGKEGLHIDGGKIIYDLRGGISPNAVLQKSGRIIDALDSNKPLYMHNCKRFFDIKSSLYTQAVNNVGRKNSIQYDIYRIKQITDWIEKNGRYPDVNAGADSLDNVSDTKEQALAEEEARIAFAIKRYQILARQYKMEYNIEPGQEDKVNEFLKLVDKIPKNGEIDFMNFQIGERTKEPSEAELTGKDFLSITEEQEKFIQIYSKAIQMNNENYSFTKKRINKLMHILQVIAMFKPSLPLPNGIITKEVVYEFWNSGNKQREIESDVDGLSIDLRDFLKNNFNENEIKEMMVLLRTSTQRKYSYHGEEYDFGRELAFARGIFLTEENEVQNNGQTVFDEYNLNIINKSGLVDFYRCPKLVDDIKKMFNLDLKDIIDHYGKIDMCFKKAKDIIKFKRNSEQRYNEDDPKKRIPPYSNKKLGVLDKFSGRSLFTGKRVLTVEEKKEQNKEKMREEKIRQRDELAKNREAIKREQKLKEKVGREKRRQQKIQEIRTDPAHFFTKQKNGTYKYKHELIYGPRYDRKKLYSFYEICDERGFELAEDEKTGKITYHLVKDIEITRFVMTQMICYGKSIDEVCQEYMKNEQIDNIEDAKDDIGFFISNTLDYYAKIPSILDTQINSDGKIYFIGVDKLLYSENDKEKAKKIEEFLKTIKDLTDMDFIEIRRSILKEDKRRLKILEDEKDKVLMRYGKNLSYELEDEIFDLKERKEKAASYLDDFR